MYLPRLHVVALLLLGGLLARAEVSQTSVPPDFAVRAHFGSGSIDPGDSAAAWDYTIRTGGKAMLKVFRFPGDATHTTRKSFSIPQGELVRLLTVIDREEFFSLPSDMLGGAEDTATYVLEITAGGKHHKVRVHDPYDVNDKRTLRRFRRVWEAVFQRIPQPDRGDAVHHLRVNS
jgi:hypothetical protein